VLLRLFQQLLRHRHLHQIQRLYYLRYQNKSRQQNLALLYPLRLYRQFLLLLQNHHQNHQHNHRMGLFFQSLKHLYRHL
jgi:hypothetical protein